jgi:chromosome segregation ATPase
MTKMDEIEGRLTAMESRVTRIETRVERAARYCRSLEERVELLEEARRRQEGEVAQVATSVRVAGAAFMTIPRR